MTLDAAIELVTVGETMGCLTDPEPRPLRFASALALSIGGAESNVAIGAARLGIATAWLGRVGDDEIGELIVGRLRSEGVHPHVARDPLRPTGLMLKSRRTSQSVTVDYYRRDNAGSRLAPEDIDEALVRRARMLHVSAITPGLGPSARDACRRAIAVAREAGVPISIDLNYRRALWTEADARDEFRELASVAEVVFATEDEARIAVPSAGSAEVADALLQLGARRVVLKRGASGASSHAAGQVLTAPAFPAVTVDEVGAGDAFAAGYLAALLRDRDERERLAWGCVMGAFAVSTIGDWEGLPTRAELLDALERERSGGPRETVSR